MSKCHFDLESLCLSSTVTDICKWAGDQIIHLHPVWFSWCKLACNRVKGVRVCAGHAASTANALWFNNSKCASAAKQRGLQLPTLRQQFTHFSNYTDAKTFDKINTVCTNKTHAHTQHVCMFCTLYMNRAVFKKFNTQKCKYIHWFWLIHWFFMSL